jgi:hypothetical protein
VQSSEGVSDLPFLDLRQILNAIEPRRDCTSPTFLQKLQCAKVCTL